MISTQLKIFESKFKKNSKAYKVYLVLKDMQWHCRGCSYSHVESTQIAGSGGIQGLRRGSSKRDGLEIKSGNNFCVECDKNIRHDKWSGQFITSLNPGSMPDKFKTRTFQLLGERDVVEKTKRNRNEITVDHKLPMIRWNKVTEKEQKNYNNMTDEEIKKNFQILKKTNGSVSHNALKSRACERCFQKGRRGKPFKINYFYKGNDAWEPDDKKNADGCIGCGWYDFDEWRNNLNKKLRTTLKIEQNTS